MLKKLLFLSICAISIYGADQAKKTDLKAEEAQLVQFLSKISETTKLTNKGIYIKPCDFKKEGKEILNRYLTIWQNAITESNVSPDTGLAKIVWDMHTDGVEKLINDLNALKKTSKYDDEFKKSFAARAIEQVQHMYHGPDGDYFFPGAKQVVTDTTRILRQNEYYNILYKRRKAPIIPKEDLVLWYYDQTTDSAKKALLLNTDNNTLSVNAIRGITLLTAYHYQWDCFNS